MRLVYLAAEGVHDVVFLGRLLKKQFGLAQVEDRAKLAEPWSPLLEHFGWPMKRRHQQREITDIKRLAVPAPVFFQSAEVSVAISNAEGISKLVERISSDLEQYLRQQITLDAVGIFLDNDEQPPNERFAAVTKDLRRDVPELPRAEKLGQVTQTSPRMGVFSMPNPESQGTLEDLLLDCAEHVYPSLAREAKQLVERREEFLAELETDERKELAAPSGTKKATVAVMGAFLKPEKAIQASLQDHRWVSTQTIERPALTPLVGFLKMLLAPPAEGSLPT